MIPPACLRGVPTITNKDAYHKGKGNVGLSSCAPRVAYVKMGGRDRVDGHAWVVERVVVLARYDSKADDFLVARDHVGICPLYVVVA